MSLWSTSLESLTLVEIDSFLETRLPEGHRLDYKLDMPVDLAKIIAAFANTLGGLIVLGVDEDSKTTQPIWPPDPTNGKGMPNKRGLREQVTQIARDAIYPPVNVRISPVIENKALPGSVLLVVRVDESRDAPHAVEKRREVYIYERDGSTSPPYKLAEVDRIAYLLGRRRSIEDDRERMLQTEIDRACRQLPKGYPLCWVSVIPVYPWRNLCPPLLCYQLHRLLMGPTGITQTVLQQMPDGSYVRGVNRAGGEILCNRVNCKGLVFDMEIAIEQDIQPDGWLDFRSVAGKLRNVIAGAAKLYTHNKAEQPGYLMVSIGMLNVLNKRLCLQLIPNCKSRNPFLDDSYRADHYIETASLIDTPQAAGSSLLEQVMYSFDMPAIENHQEFFRRNWENL